MTIALLLDADPLPIRRDPADVQDYSVDFTAWLAGNTLSSVTLSVTGSLVAAQVTLASVYVFRVSGGTANTEGTVTLTATSSGGRVRKRSITFATAAL